MAILDIRLMSEALMRTVDVMVVLPADKLAFPGAPEPKRENFKTIYLLHGIFGSSIDWLSGTRVERFATDRDIAIVMPSGENSFYQDHPAAQACYARFIGEELPRVMERMFRLSAKREDRYIAGLSMGGYGALRTGLLYADTFSKIGAFSAAIITDGIEKRTNDSFMWLERRDYAEACFGDLDKVENSDKNPLWCMRDLKARGKQIPEIFMACGTKDSLYGVNIKYRDAFLAEGAKLTWHEAPYAHEWDFWDLELKNFIDLLPAEEGAGAGVNSGNVGI